MAASNTDLFRKNAPLFSTTLNGAISASSTSIVMQAVSGLPTDTGLTLVIDATDAQGNLTPAKQETVKGVVSTGTVSLINAIRGVEGTAQSHATGATVYGYVTAADHNDTITGILTQHKQDGTHTGITTDTITATTGTFTNLTVTGSNTAAGWSPLGQTLTYASNNGNKEFTATAAADLRNTLSPGMKLQVTRNTVPPTQCMAFASASSQYATKASPSGMSTAWTAFTLESWIYPTSYTGSAAGVIGRSDDATAGWMLELNGSGQVRAYYATGSTFTDFVSYQSVPLNQFTHIAVSVSSTSSKTANIYINGILVPSFSALTGAAALAQGTANLSVGGMGAGVVSRYFNGYISEARVWSVAQTQTQIQNNMAINCVGNEPNLVCLIPGNGNFNDLTSNANNLTATNGAIATQANNPYNAIEYAVVNTVSYSNPTTTITLDTGLNCTIPNQTLNAPQYSTAENPFGVTGGLEKNRTLAFVPIQSASSTSSTSMVQANGFSTTVTVPGGGAKLKITVFATLYNSSAGAGVNLTVWDGVVGSGTQIGGTFFTSGVSNGQGIQPVTAFVTAPAGSKTYNVGFSASTGTANINASTTSPAYLLVETIS